MELITIDGYTEDDKVAIARDHLLPRQRERAALTEDEVVVTDDALREIAANHTREPGCGSSNASSPRRSARPRRAWRTGRRNR